MSQRGPRNAGLLLVICMLGVACASDDAADAGDTPVSDPAADTTGDSGDDEPTEQVGVFLVDGPDAIMSGEIGGSTPDEVRRLIADHPDVTTIVLENVPGSGDDDANIEASRLVREAGLNTHVDSDGFIASGGVDFYLAGVERTFDEGASFGVHSWASSDGVEGKDVPQDDPEHLLYLDYYDEVGISADFYWFTLEAAPAEELHIMTPDELVTYGFATE